MVSRRKCGRCGGEAVLESVTEHERQVRVMFVPVGTHSMGSSLLYICASCNQSFTLKSGGAIAGLVVAMLLLGFAFSIGASFAGSSSDGRLVILLLVGGAGSVGVFAALMHQVWLRAKNPPVA